MQQSVDGQAYVESGRGWAGPDGKRSAPRWKAVGKWAGPDGKRSADGQA